MTALMDIEVGGVARRLELCRLHRAPYLGGVTLGSRAELGELAPSSGAQTALFEDP